MKYTAMDRRLFRGISLSVKSGKLSLDLIQNKVSDPQFFLSFANDYYANIVNEAQT